MTIDEVKTHPSPFQQTLYEEYSPSVRSVTLICKDAIYYGVEVRQREEWVTEWSRTVPFLRQRTHRPGGPAFVWAARQQNIEAKCWMAAFAPEVGES